MICDHELISHFCRIDDFINDWEEQEMQNLLTMGQSPSIIHVGCGADTKIPKIEVFWPDGAYSLLENVRGRRVVTIRHPDE